MRILLDTHIFLWFINEDSKLGAEQLEILTDETHQLYLSAASVWEAGIKFALGKLPLPSPPHVYFPSRRVKHGIESLPIEEADIASLASIPRLHNDPFDRIIIAQALRHDMIIATVDNAIRQYAVNCL